MEVMEKKETFWTDKWRQPKIGKIFLFVFLASCGLTLLISSVKIIEPNEVGVIYNAFGGINHDKILRSGWHLKIPILQKIYSITVSRDTISMFGTYDECKQNSECDDMEIKVLTSEGLNVAVDLSVFYKVKPEKSPEIVEELTINYVQGTLVPRIRGIVRDVVGDMKVTEVYGPERERLAKEVFEKLEVLMEKDGFILEEVSIRDIDPPQTIVNAIEQKQKTEQEWLEKEIEKKKAQLESERQLIEAQGNADKVRVEGESLQNNPEYLELKKLEVMQKLYENENLKLVIVPSDSMPIIPTSELFQNEE